MGLWGNDTAINFPNLGISLHNVPRGITVFGFNIAFYGVIIALGMIGGILLARWQAKRSGQDPELYLDYALWAIPLAVIGARLYSVAFEWDYYRDNLLEIVNLRNGGLAIYGGVIGACLTALVFAKIKKANLPLMLDTGVLGLILGQVCGRWGNFVNRECFGNYTNSLFAMQIDVNDVNLNSHFKPAVIPDAALAKIYEGKERALEAIMQIRNNLTAGADGNTYIQVQPTFLYESLWNLALLIFCIIYSPKKKFDGEIMLIYLGGYGLGRFWIEGLRTDQLFLWNSGIAVSQLLSAVMVVFAAAMIILCRIRAAKKRAAEQVQDSAEQVQDRAE